TRHADQSLKLNDVFDIIAGNSTGSIIAGLVALGTPTSKITSFYSSLASKAFPSPARSPHFWLITILVNPLLAAVFSCVVFLVAKLLTRLLSHLPLELVNKIPVLGKFVNLRELGWAELYPVGLSV